MENAAIRGCTNILIESDSQVAIMEFKNPKIIPWDLRNRWDNYLGGVKVVYSHIFHEGNICAEKMDFHDHSINNFIWWNSPP